MSTLQHWLPVPQQIQFKVAVFKFICVQGAGPAYFQHVCIATANLSGHASLCSAGCGDLAVLRTATELLKRSFHIVALDIWNRTFALAHHIQSTVSMWPKNPPAGL